MYIELHARSAFSFLQAAALPEELAQSCAALEMPARPARRCSIEGDGMVNLAVLLVVLRRKAKSSIITGFE